MAGKWLRIGVAVLIVLAGGCARKHVQAPPIPPPPKQNVFVLLPDPEGKAGGIVVKNAAGAQDLSQSYQAVRVERSDVSPSPTFPLDPADVRRLFGAALDVLPLPEVQFTLYFDEGRDVLTPESAAQLPAILNAIRERRSTAITVTGHTDTVDTPQFNYQLGMRRAHRVEGILIGQGVNASDLFVSSHGDADLIVKTVRGVAESRNRRVEVIVR
ncbi:MAG: OmpA family protein [Acidobacteriia bacterium]|nr:OmpA family protein [Terriglobia bacterium]